MSQPTGTSDQPQDETQTQTQIQTQTQAQQGDQGSAGALTGRTVLFLTANEGIEEAELLEPWRAVQEAGGTPVLASPRAGDVQLFAHLDRTRTVTAQMPTAEVEWQGYDALMLPGGVANADELRMDDAAVRIVKEMTDAGRPVGVICHGPWAMVEADVLDGRMLTSWPSLQTDLENAGADWKDQEVVVCRTGAGPIISSRKPDDLPAFTRALVQEVAAATR